MMSVRKILLRVLVVTIPLSLGILFSQYMSQGQGTLEGVSATVLPEARALPDFVLEDHHGNEFTNESLKDQWSFVFFGYTHCPDVCPTTLADTDRALDELGERAADVNLALITIDPDRDTPEIVSDYVEAFIDGSIALRTDDDDKLLDAADAFGVTYSVVDNDAGEIEVGHTPNLFVVDDQGSLVLTWPFGVPSADITSDLNILLDRRP